MEVLTIEKNTFEEIQQEVNEVISMAEIMLSKFKPERIEWLDHANVCMMLNISKRTLQNYKDRGILPYSCICRKSYFKLSDVEDLLKKITKSKK
jgi:hypothetical protein